jgi:hypothetical protein
MSNEHRSGVQFEIWVEKLFRRLYFNVERHTVYELLDNRTGKKLASAQVDISHTPFCRSVFRERVYMDELKYSSGFTINEDAIGQLLDSHRVLSKQSAICFIPRAVVTTTDFTRAAYASAARHRIELIPGRALMAMYRHANPFAKPISLGTTIASVDPSQFRTKPNYVHVDV